MEQCFNIMEFKIFKKDTDIRQQRNLFKECFPENANTSVESESHYLWKFHSFPSNQSSYEFGAFSDGELIGYYAAIPYKYVINKKNINVGMVCDVMTGVKARGKGVFTQIGIYSTNQLKENGLAFSIGYPIRPEVIPGHLKAGWEKMFSLPLYIKFLDFSSILKTKKIGFLAPAANVFLKTYNGILSIINRENTYDVKMYSSHSIDEIIDFDEFFINWIEEQPIALNKNIEFLKWRLGAPDKQYNIIVARKDKKIVGYAIVSYVIKENVPSIAILDISSLNGYKGIAKAIFKKIDVLAKQKKAEAIMIMASQHLCKKHDLRKNGFLKSPFKFILIIKNLSNEFSNKFLKNKKNWHLTWIDSDDL